jgi:DNA polymerase IV (DinB-like DNA polymerase)
MHIDMDAFYASVEQRENPTLLAKPVIIGADPKDGKGRGVVAACSYEARKYGVHSAQPISQAYRLCPDGIYLRPNFELYETVSAETMSILRQFSEKLEQISIDEAFLDVTEKVTNFDEAAALAATIKLTLKDRIKLTCSIGVAPNKSLAKIASDFKKPDGLTVVQPQRIQKFLAPLPVSKISGIGKKSYELLREKGISTIGDLAATHPSRLTEIFGKYGTQVWQIANGIDDEEIVTSYSVKSISSEITFEEDTSDTKRITEAFSSLINDVHARTLSQDLLFRSIGIKVRFEDFSTYTRAKSHSRYTNEKPTMEQFVKLLFKEFDNAEKKIRLVGVRVSNLKKADSGQETILSYADRS